MKIKRPYSTVMPIAEALIERLAPACHRIEVAGSLRRQCDEIGDIELIAVPILNAGLMPGVPGAVSKINFLDMWASPHIQIIKDGDKYKQFTFKTKNKQQYQVDLFLQPDPQTWGVNYMIRTGSKDFARRMVTSTENGGFRPWRYRVENARVIDIESNLPLPTPEEMDVFTFWNMEFIPPKNRQ